MAWLKPRLAPTDLRSTLVCSWTAEPCGTHQLVPDGCIDLLWLNTGMVLLCGPEIEAWEFSLPPGIQAVGVRFRPGYAPPVFLTAASELRDRQVRLADVLTSAEERRLIEQLGEAADPLDVLEDFVRHRVGIVAGPDRIDQAIGVLRIERHHWHVCKG